MTEWSQVRDIVQRRRDVEKEERDKLIFILEQQKKSGKQIQRFRPVSPAPFQYPNSQRHSSQQSGMNLMKGNKVKLRNLKTFDVK